MKKGIVTRIDTIEIDGVPMRLRHGDAPEKGETGFFKANGSLSKRYPVGSTITYQIVAHDKYGRPVIEIQ